MDAMLSELVVPPELKQGYRRWLLASGLVALLLLVLTAIYFTSHDNIQEKRDAEHFSELFNMQLEVTQSLRAAISDLIYFSQSELAQEVLTHQDKRAEAYLNSLMWKIGSLQQQYDQLKLLNADGKEVIRLNQLPDLSMVQVPEFQLQNKADRYYFTQAKKLAIGESYVSPFDLNQEKGVIERPLKSVIRLGTPIYSEESQFLGVGVINYRGGHIFELLQQLKTYQGDQLYLLNSQGYYLSHPDAGREWGGLLPERQKFNFAKEYPGIWRQMSQQPSGEYNLTDGEYYYTRFSLLSGADIPTRHQEFVTLVMHVPNAVIINNSRMLLRVLLVTFVLLAPLLAYLGWRMGDYQIEQKWLLKTLAFEAHHDVLTGLLNRKAILNALQREILNGVRHSKPLVVAFIDVNDLKIVNDQLGHERGDELICSASKAISEVIRETDYAARLGGDEFLIVLPDCHEGDAYPILERIGAMFATFGRQKGGVCWSLSYGCSSLLGDSDTAEQMIDRADVAMYQHKKSIKARRRKGSNVLSINQVKRTNVI